jgi:hypothetical protein
MEPDSRDYLCVKQTVHFRPMLARRQAHIVRMKPCLPAIPAHSFPTETDMTLNFPNKSRSFDEVKQTVRFQGYDGMFEVRFLVEAAALMKGAKAVEADCLNAFDRARSTIQDVAVKHYAKTRRSNYLLTAADLK